MRIWVETDTSSVVNFFPETEEEMVALDKVLGYVPWKTRPIGDKCWKKIGEGAERVAVLGGHERQRWIIIDEKVVPADTKSAVDEKRSYSQCVHGKCLGHVPEWENVGSERLVPNPTWFGLKNTHWLVWCCGKPMLRKKLTQVLRCIECKITTKDFTTHGNVAYCSCCQKTILFFEESF
jgi:hypothetical protein